MGGGRPLFAGLRLNHHPHKNYWSFYIALPALSSNSAPKARMLPLLKIFVPNIVSSVAKPPGMPKEFCNLWVTACTPARFAV